MARLVAVTGASGAQGSTICEAFLAAGWRVRGLTRARRDLRSGAEAWPVGGYEPAGLAGAFREADTVVLNAPVDYRPGVRESLALSVAEAAAAAGVRRILLNTGAEAFEGYPRRISRSLFRMREILAAAPVAAAAVQPTVFMDNLLSPALAAGIASGRFVYPVPAEARIAWVSHGALAAAVVAASDRGEPGEVYRIGGPEALTAPEIAGRLGAVLGRAVAHEALPPDDFARMLPASVGEHVADYYRRLQALPDALARNDGCARLGVDAESFGDWASRQDWGRAAGEGS